MVRIILIRHGETQWNIEGRYQGQEDTHLSERGQLQGRMVADGLKNTPIDVAISSPLERSYMTLLVLRVSSWPYGLKRRSPPGNQSRRLGRAVGR